jgi:hypothetical protein
LLITHAQLCVANVALAQLQSCRLWMAIKWTKIIQLSLEKHDMT